MKQPGSATVALRQFGDRLASITGLEAVIDASLEGIDDLLGHNSSLLLVYQPELDRLVTLASHGYDSGGVGSEVALGEGVIGMAAARQRSMRIGNLQRMLSYARTVQRTASSDPDRDDIRLPGLHDAGSQMAAPLMARGVLLGVLAVESRAELAYDEHDENVFAVAAHLVASALDREQLLSGEGEPGEAVVVSPALTPRSSPTTPSAPEPVVIRHYAIDGSTFLDDDYVIKGVAGRLLWKVISDYASTGRTAFTNREAKLDPVLGLPPYRDNFESRLVLLKRRLDERDAPLHIVSTGRGRFELHLSRPVVLDHIET